MNKIWVIGIGYRPLDKKAKGIIYNSAVILASTRLLEVFKGYEDFENVKDRIKVINNVHETMDYLRTQITEHRTQTQYSELRTIVLLASGDPMFFGIGRIIVNEFGKDMVEIFPDLSSIQVAFSRIKETWSDAFFISLHGGPDPAKRRKLQYEIKDIPVLLEKHNKIAILTDKVNSPAEIAKKILKFPAFSFQPSALKMYVCEKLGYPDEKITEGGPHDIASMTFSDPNLVITLKTDHGQLTTDKRSSDIKFGLKEDEIQHSRGLITKDEIRAVTIHKLRLPQKGVFWDIGAGSGSVSIEAAKLNSGLRIFAIEKDDEQIENINENKKRYHTADIEIIKGEAPDALKGLPTPARVLIGGSGGKLREIVSSINAKMDSGIIVINATTIDTLNEALQSLNNAGGRVEVCEISVSRSKMVNQRRHLSALNPIFIITGEKI